ncbi:TolB family protein [Anaerosacchariphilus polymeriproducens]|nr:PD40 domain-containing protein [Anaerosacchariphilus polymeriproducens]
MKKAVTLFLLCLTLGLSIFNDAQAAQENPEPEIKGKMVYHTYSSYEAQDSKLYVYDFSSKENRCISEELTGVTDAMNGDFGSESDEIIFMGISVQYNEWHIYRYNLKSRKLTDLTPGNEYSYQDPKYSPDGKKIVYKRGKWDNKRNTMVYDIVEKNLSDLSQIKLTNDVYEDSMPYYSMDGKKVYYARGVRKNSAIYSVTTSEPHRISKVYGANNICSYYPITDGNGSLYFSKWYSAQNETDQIMEMKTDTKSIKSLAFNSKDYNCSDACPVFGEYMIISSTKAGGQGNYDLYIVNKNSGAMWSLNNYNQTINDANHQLGASFLEK